MIIRKSKHQTEMEDGKIYIEIGKRGINLAATGTMTVDEAQKAVDMLLIAINLFFDKGNNEKREPMSAMQTSRKRHGDSKVPYI